MIKANSMSQNEQRGREEGRMWKRKRAEREKHGGIGEGEKSGCHTPDAMAQIWSVTHASSL